MQLNGYFITGRKVPQLYDQFWVKVNQAGDSLVHCPINGQRKTIRTTEAFNNGRKYNIKTRGNIFLTCHFGCMVNIGMICYYTVLLFVFPMKAMINWLQI